MDRSGRFGAVLLTVTMACAGNNPTGPGGTGGSGSSSCRVDFVSVPAAPVPASGGTFAATFSTSCMLSVASDQPWITVTSAPTVSPNSMFTVTYTVAPNASGALRTGTVVFSRSATDRGGGFTVTQLA